MNRTSFLIYRCLSKITEMSYIGQIFGAHQTLERRWRQHCHPTERTRNLHLEKAIQEQGIDKFQITILDCALTKPELDFKEKFYISLFDTYEHGYNGTRGGNAPGIDSLIKMSRAKQGKLPINLSKLHISNKGRKHSPETCRKIGDKHRGKTVSEETRQKIRKIHLGKKMPPRSDEAKQKMKEIMTGRKITWGDKISETRLRLKLAEGINNPSAKLTEQQVLKIREMYNQGVSKSELAKLFNAGWTTISRVVKRETWCHL